MSNVIMLDAKDASRVLVDQATKISRMAPMFSSVVQQSTSEAYAQGYRIVALEGTPAHRFETQLLQQKNPGGFRR